MKPRIEAIVKPELLIWARDSAGFSIEEAAKKASVTSDRLEKWEKGELNPTINQLRKLGGIYRRPLAVFYLPEPPEIFKPLKDFRRLPEEEKKKLSPELRFEIRKAKYRRETAIDLYKLNEEPIPEFELTIKLTDKPEEIAKNLRELLGLTYLEQFSWVYPNQALNNWRAALENIGVLVFQASKISLKEMRGFSFSDKPLPVIVANVSDIYTARIFSMMHEFVHILLKKGGLCDLKEKQSSYDEKRTEIFCNHVAGAVLVSEAQLREEKIVINKGQKKEWDDAEIKILAKKYSVSHEVILRRLLITRYITNDFYQEKRKFYKPRKKPKKTEGFPTPDILAVSYAGKHFIRLVLSSYYNNKITSSDVSDYLGVRLKHLSNIEDAVYPKWNIKSI